MLNWQRSYRHLRTGAQAATIAALYSTCTDEERQLSRVYLERYLAGRGSGGLTAIGEGPGPLAGLAQLAGCNMVEDDLETALTVALRDAGTCDVAVSGGVDSWLLAALLKHAGVPVCAWYLESGVPGYCEKEQVVRMAKALDVACEFVRASIDDFLQLLPEFVATTESPIYNLHPVSKLLLARAVAERGVTTLISGDGADQVMRWDWHCDLLPLTLTCFRATGVHLATPFLSEGVVALCRTPQQDKAPVRELACQLGVPNVAKQPTLFPPIAGLNVGEHTTKLLIEHLENGAQQ